MSIGIDFGTLLNKIGCFNHVGFRIITNDYRNPATPSVAFLNHKDHWLFGEKGAKLGLTKPNQCICESKIMLGCKFNDERVLSNLNYWKFNIIKGKKEKIQIEISVDDEKHNVFPYEIVGKILKNLIEITKSRLPKPIHQTIISIPATFDKNQKIDLIKAAKLADIQNAHYVIEPILTSIAYLYNANLNPSEKRNILIYSFGFSNPESSILQIHDETYEITTKIDTKLNGRQFDENVFKYIDNEMKKKYPTKVEFIEQQKTQIKLRVACDEAKIFLSENQSADVVIKDDEKDDDEEDEEEEKRSLFVTLSCEKFNEINKDLFDHSMDSVKDVFNEAKIDMKSIDFLFLVGGMSKMKKIREKLKELTDMDPQSFADPCEAPTLGACILGAHLLMKDSPEIMFQRNSIFFDNLEVFEKVLLDDDLDAEIDSSDSNDDDDFQNENESNENLPLISNSIDNKSATQDENLNDACNENNECLNDKIKANSNENLNNKNDIKNKVNSDENLNNANNENDVKNKENSNENLNDIINDNDSINKIETQKKDVSVHNENIEELNSSLILIKEEVERLTKTLDDITDDIVKTSEPNETSTSTKTTALTEEDDPVKTLEFFTSVKDPVSQKEEDLNENSVKETDDEFAVNKSAEFEKENQDKIENQEEIVYYVTPIKDPDILEDEKDQDKNEEDYDDDYEEEEDSYDDDEKVEFDFSSEKVEFDISSGKIDSITSSSKSVMLDEEAGSSSKASGILDEQEENSKLIYEEISAKNIEDDGNENLEQITENDDHLARIIKELQQNIPDVSNQKGQNQVNQPKSKVLSVVNNIVDYFDYIIIGFSCIALFYFAYHMF